MDIETLNQEGVKGKATRKPVYKSATFWTTHGPAAPFVGWALLGADGQPVSLRITALVIGGLLVLAHAILRTINKAVGHFCRAVEKNPWLVFALPAGIGAAGWMRRAIKTNKSGVDVSAP